MSSSKALSQDSDSVAPEQPSQPEKQATRGGGVSIESQGGVIVGGDVVGRDKIINSTVNNIVTQHFYSSRDLQIGYLPPAVQYELVDHKEQLKRALRGLKARKAVLLWGMGGVGKTNLAAHAAYAASKDFKDGVIWIQVGNGDVFALCDGLARALGDSNLPRLLASEKVDAVRRLLAGKRALLVLDDVREPKTLEAAPGLCPPTAGLLATSRQTVAAFPVKVELMPLEHPQARILFCQRADLPAHMADDPHVEAICREWGGYPLGVVLSAGRAATEKLPLERLVQHLRQVRLPGKESAYVSPELNEVQNLLEDHFQPLRPTELALLNLIAVNLGKSISLKVLAPAAQLSELEAETTIGSLIKVQLVTRTGERYSIHDVIRDAVLRRLSSAEIDRLGVRLSKSLEEHLTEKLPFEGRWCVAPPAVWRELESDFESCLGAIRWCLASGHRQLAWNLYRLVDYPLGSLGYWDQETQICKEVIARAGEIDPGQTAWWKALVLGYIHWQRMEYEEARALAQEALQAFATRNDLLGIADVNLLIANIITYKLKDAQARADNYEELVGQARSLFEQAIATFEAHHNLRSLAHALGDFTDYWYYLLERYDVALPYCHRSIEIFAQLGDEEGWVMAQPPLCDIYSGLGEFAQAEGMLGPMREAVHKLGRPDIEPHVDWSEAELREKQGDAFAKKNKRKALAYYRRGREAATRCRKAFAQVKMPHEVRELQLQEQRIKRKIKKLTG
jgi:tetratricopeptide (TPR) repeat protein